MMTNTVFGNEITAKTIVDTMQSFNHWEDKYRQVIKWGKMLPMMDDSFKTEQVMVAGCESQVWLISKQSQNVWYFQADSDARIVRGLIALVMAAFNGKTSQEIQQFDVEDYFEKIGLISHLSPSRGNGLYAIVEQIKNRAI
ncbi:cysteine desulfurase, sulfur acceptor subunit CsdE [Vibrio sp. MACH09]|uniref:SufE family protein n=1 Tax=Vibrio sp. MACH09 TaxID=3025122 RepID=UPI002793DF62|nr:SufE family protein [Vibrio sp. MACH09]GLO61674.1 cysteine desulfurase, sulfur acceptor subunit CsdE [Vibrio sp. MACH09]